MSSSFVRSRVRKAGYIAGCLLLVLAAVVGVQLMRHEQPTDRRGSAIIGKDMVFGVLGSACDADRAIALRKAGVSVAQLDIEWSRFEPSNGRYSSDYVSELNTNLNSCRKAGLNVSIGLGIPNAPNWVRDLPDGRYINQAGDSYSGQTPNIVFSKDVRASFASYAAKVFELLRLDGVSSIRIGTSQAGELGYPAAMHAFNSFWAFDDAAQTGNGLPANMTPTPLRGWTPGAKTWRGSVVSQQQVSDWFSWYSEALTKAVVWQIEVVRALGYGGHFILPLAGRGALPADLNDALAAGLNGTADRDGSLEGGLYYPTQLKDIAAAVGTDGISADVTGLDDATAVDARLLSPPQDACQDGDAEEDLMKLQDADQWSASRWTVANARQAGLGVVGENPGSPEAPGTGGHAGSDNLRSQMHHAPKYAVGCGLSAMFWAFEDDMFGDPSELTLGDYARAIKESNGP